MKIPGGDYSLRDAIARRTLQESFTCAICHRDMEHGGDRVTLRRSWKPETETICAPCWHVMMLNAAYGIEYLKQRGELPDTPMLAIQKTVKHLERQMRQLLEIDTAQNS